MAAMNFAACHPRMGGEYTNGRLGEAQAFGPRKPRKVAKNAKCAPGRGDPPGANQGAVWHKPGGEMRLIWPRRVAPTLVSFQRSALERSQPRSAQGTWRRRRAQCRGGCDAERRNQEKVFGSHPRMGHEYTNGALAFAYSWEFIRGWQIGWVAPTFVHGRRSTRGWQIDNPEVLHAR
jgi:hypothetical protein